MSSKLTKDSDALICLLYKNYCQQRKNGVSKANARLFGGSDDIQKDIAPKWSFENVDETCRELHNANLIGCSYYDNVAQNVWLTDNGIIYMENRFKDGLKEVLDYLGKIKDIIPTNLF